MTLDWSLLFVGVESPSTELWRTLALLFAATGQTLFALFYCTFPWRENYLGRALFSKALVFALALDLLIAGRMFDWRGEDYVYATTYTVLTITIWGQLFAFMRVKAEGRERQDVSGNDDSDETEGAQQ